MTETSPWPAAALADDTTMSFEQKAFVYEKMIRAFRKIDHSCEMQGMYCKRPETQHVDCGRVLQGDKDYLSTLTGGSRIPLIPDPYLNMKCPAINSRIRPHHLHFDPLMLSGTAFARIVYTDYEFIEKQIQVSYHPQNYFCFAVDQKSPEEFHEKMRKLSECLPNVIVLPATESYDSEGHNNNLAHYKCMQELISRPGWSYLMLLQQHDVITKSVYELDRIFELLGGANDLWMAKEIAKRRNKKLKWTPRELRMFGNDSAISKEVLDSELKFSTGYVQGSLSRDTVEWMVRKVDLSVFIDQWNQSKYGGDEQYLTSLNINPALGMPGHFTDECLKQDVPVPGITRFSIWAQGSSKQCATKKVRNELCIFGIEDFRGVSGIPALMFNKMIPAFDYSIVECTAELIYNRTFLGQVNDAFNEEFYKNMVTVQYHQYHNDPGYVLNCTSDYTPLEYDKYLF
ncbi:hypothetical protein L5515_015405 [Caenorhabditis briggsae]|uniref:Uncharacterized protein n=1 Tax=Caenorhabditis briggsae TaxID=6238 RepID=A0AAE9EF59_CAEBR|nr:hypothetical protein L5515_015405 [Caenorhabditis briggsae]